MATAASDKESKRKGGYHMRGVFTISLDFELHWGGFEKWPLQTGHDSKVPNAYNQYFLNTRDTIPKMLELFARCNVHVTWATVGMLFHRTREELLNNIPDSRPTYVEKQLSAYHYIENSGIGKDEQDDPFHYAPTLINKITNTPFQELGTHTFAHYYCNEEGQTLEQFRQDMRAAQRAAKEYGTVLRSLVFPRNQFNDQYLKVCFEEGITSVRSNPLDWFWRIDSTQKESTWKRLNRGLDAYFPVGKKNTYPPSVIENRENLPLCIPASRLLRPYNSRETFLNKLKIERIKQEMTRAAKANEVYHLWWHPHNFGNYPIESLTALQEILGHFELCGERYGMQSLNMGEITNLVKNG